MSIRGIGRTASWTESGSIEAIETAEQLAQEVGVKRACQVLEVARSWAAEFFDWYNYEHHHSALGLLTPVDVHFGRAPAVLQQRQQVLEEAYLRTAQRFVKGLPQPLALPAVV